MAQFNATVGDLPTNCQGIERLIHEARAVGSGIVAFPELAVCGYPPEDLVLLRDFARASRASIERLLPATEGTVAVVGFVDWVGDEAYNAAAILVDGCWADTYHKRRLPNYGVFDEERYFAAGRRIPVYRMENAVIGVSICEDIWYPGEPVDALSRAGAELIININASPYERGRILDRSRMLATRAADNVVALAYVNAVGGQDELVFDGGSLIFGPRGELLARGPQLTEGLVIADVDLDDVLQARLRDPRHRTERRAHGWPGRSEYVDIKTTLSLAAGSPRGCIEPLLDPCEEVWTALVLGTRDYMRKTGFSRAVVGLSGGIDSSVVAALAVDAVGADNVVGVAMPSRYSSEHSLSDAAALSRNLGIRLLTVPIEPAHAAMLEMLAPIAGGALGQAEENLQARQRGNVLMTISNYFGWLVLTTGNKSEMATGYATLYGDMAGGFAVIKDVPKTLVYRLTEWRNMKAGTDLIPKNVLTKPPSAELRPGQIDAETLPPYETLDAILEAYIEQDRAPRELLSLGYDEETVSRVVAMVDRNEYKRRQAPPGVKITPRAFGRDRRMPLATSYNWRNLPTS